MQPFAAVDALGQEDLTVGEVYAAVRTAFDDPARIRPWSFTPETECAAAARLAARVPDSVLPVVPACQYRWQETRRFPATIDVDVVKMRRCAADALAACFDDGVPDRNARLRVVTMTPWLPDNPNNNLLRVIAGYHAGLLRHPDVEDAAILVTNENAVSLSSDLPGARPDARSARAVHEAVVAEFGAPPDGIVYAPPPFVDGGNVERVKRFIAEFRPNVLFFPNMELTAAYAHAFAKSCATVFLQTSIRNRPAYDFDRYLYLGEPREIDASHIMPERWHYHPFGYERFGMDFGLSRSDIGLPDDAFVLVTAGNRLETEINPEIVGIVGEVMRRNPRVVWMLLGVQDEMEILENLGPSFVRMWNRVVTKGYVHEIGDYLALSDLYVNPRRTGGAVSMALSIYGGTPVLTFPGNDAGTFVIDELVCADAERYRDLLQELSQDESRLAHLEEKQRGRFVARHTIDASVADLVTQMREASQARWGGA